MDADSPHGVQGPNGVDQRRDHETRDRIDQLYEELSDRQAAVENEVIDLIQDAREDRRLLRRIVGAFIVGAVIVAVGFGLIIYGFTQANDRDTKQAQAQANLASDVARDAQRRADEAQKQRRVSSARACVDREALKLELRGTLRLSGASSATFDRLPVNPLTGRRYFAPLPGPGGVRARCDQHAEEQTPSTKGKP